MGIFDDRVDDTLDQWIYSFKNHEVKEGFKAPGIKEMSEKLGCIDEQYSKNTTSLDYISMTPEKQRAYNKHLEDLASERGTLKYARDEGIKKGKIEGKVEGELIGLIKTARNLLKEGSEVSFVSKITGLSIEEINKLK